MDGLPIVSDYLAERFALDIKDREGMQRLPVVTAKVLAFMALLEDSETYFPNRPTLAEHLDVSIPAVDVVLSQRQGTQDFHFVHFVEQGRVRQRVSTVQRRRAVVAPWVRDRVRKHVEDERRR